MARSKVIVIIDDDVISIEILQRFLVKDGFTVHLSRDGQAGLDLIRKLKPDMVISDMLLPRLHGLDVCKKIKADEELRKTVVVLMTAVYRDEKYKDEVDKVGADGFFLKPFDLARVLSQVQHLLHEVDIEDEEPDPIEAQLNAAVEEHENQVISAVTEIEKFFQTSRELGPDQVKQMYGLLKTLAMTGETLGNGNLERWANTLAGFLSSLAEEGIPVLEMERRRIETYLVGIRQAATGGPTDAGELTERQPNQTNWQPRFMLVYLVESDTAFANELALQLELFGYKVEIFDDLAELKAKSAPTPPDAVIMEFSLPQGQLIDLKKHPVFLKVPLVFLSTENDLRARLMAIRAGGDAFFTKPVDNSLLMARLAELTNPREPDPFRVLIIEDEPLVADLFARTLAQADMLTRVVTNPFDTLGPLFSFNPDLILLDLYMPGCDGVELARLIRQHEAYIGVPIVFLSGETNIIKQQDAMLEGVDDFLTKPIKPGHLVSAVTHRIQRFRLLRAHMVRDCLTGLSNISTVQANLTIEIERARRRKELLAVAMIDIDRLGEINDTYGYTAGDMVIRALARILTQRLRRSDIVGRYEGSSILVVLSGSDGLKACRVLDEIKRDFSFWRHQFGDTEITATFSCGLSTFPRFAKEKTLIEAAQNAMRKAKRHGRNRIELAE